MLTSESSTWTLAELRFESATCTYTEIRRVRYEWPREAFGALLSRVVVSGDVDLELVQETSDDFSNWLGSQFRDGTSTDA